MSYGQDKPWGFQAVESNVSASPNAQTQPFLIASGYAQNIFKGDLVYVSTDGYLRNFYDYGQNPGTDSNTGYQTVPCLGVFNGCQYAVPAAVNPTDPYNPGHAYWPANTNTLGNVAAIASVIVDANTVFSVQVTGNVGLTQSLIGSFFKASYDVVNGIVQGDTGTGQSYLSVNADTGARGGSTNTYNAYLQALDADVRNVAGQQFNNGLFVIANHYFRQMPLQANVQ